MRAYSLIWIALAAALPLYADSDEEIAFEEALIEAEDCKEGCHHRYHLPTPYSDGEERMYHEQTESYWPGKREDTLLDQIIH